MSFGAPFCRGVEPFLANLKTLLQAADVNGVGDWPAVQSARAVYEDIDSFVVYTPWGGDSGDCARHTREVQAAIAKVQLVLNAIPGYLGTALPRPEAEVQEYGLIPAWAKVAGFGILGLAALHYLTPFFKPRRFSGYRRRGRR